MSNQATHLPRLLTVSEAANYLGFTERHLRRLVSERRITYVKDVKLLRFDVRDLDAWIDSHRRPVAEPPPIWY